MKASCIDNIVHGALINIPNSLFADFSLVRVCVETVGEHWKIGHSIRVVTNSAATRETCNLGRHKWPFLPFTDSTRSGVLREVYTHEYITIT